MVARPPGLRATGDSLDECEARMLDAIAFHLEGMETNGDPIPDGTGPGVYVSRGARTAA